MMRHYLARSQTIARALGLVALVCAGAFPTGIAAQSPAPPVAASAQSTAEKQVDDLAERVWQWNLESDFLTRMRLGLPITQFPDLTLAQAQEDAAQARAFHRELSAIDASALSHDHDITRLFLMTWLQDRADLEKDFLYSFQVTPYTGGWAFLYPQTVLAAHPVATPTEREGYLTLVREYADLVEQVGAKLELQASQGIRLPRPALPSARSLVRANATNAAAHVTPSDERLAAMSQADRVKFDRALRETISGRLNPAFDRLIAILGTEYEERAPETVGLEQYPGGREAYMRAIRRHTGYASTPEHLHELGLARVAALSAEMEAIRRELGFEGSQSEFHRMLRTDPRFLAQTPQDVEDRYNLYISRIEPLIADYFSVLPEAPYGVRRLEPAQEPGQAFGFYQLPTEAEPTGIYRYNGSNLKDRSLIGAASLIYHELIPGHHFQVALQAENDELPEIRKYSQITAYTEGWAEYAAGLGLEMGLYADPYDRYGRLAMKSFLAARLVADTGLNSLGWSLEQTREYMLAHSMMSDTEIASDTLRYSTDLPGQALAYNLGYSKLLELRTRAEAELGEDFDIRAFHQTILSQGATPMNVLENHVDWFIAENRPKDGADNP